MKTEATIDRIEEDRAVLILEEPAEVISWPAALLPPGSKEGDIISISLKINRNKTEKSCRQISRLIEELEEGKEK